MSTPIRVLLIIAMFAMLWANINLIYHWVAYELLIAIGILICSIALLVYINREFY